MAVIQRPVKGSRISSFYPVHELPLLASLDSAFQLQEYISLLIRLNVHDVDTIVAIPGKHNSHERDLSDGSAEKDIADKEGKSEVSVDESCWVYEQLRRLAQDLSHPLITTLQQECTRQTCPEMKAGEWLYLCVAHGNDGAMEQCCAIDYILHTLDSATALLNSPRAFPSRLSIPPASTRHFSSLARRLGRIFAHAYYHHREAFEQAEAESSLYARFLALTSRFSLVPAEFLVIPPRMSIHAHGRDENERDDNESASEEPEEPIDLDPSEYMNTARRIHGQERQWLQPNSGTIRGVSPPGPAGDTRNPSPRKGRSRTDTMVHSEAVNVAEELARGHLSEVDLDKEIAQERLISDESYSLEYPESQPQSSQRIQFEESSLPVAILSDDTVPQQLLHDPAPVELLSEVIPPSEIVEEESAEVEKKDDEVPETTESQETRETALAEEAVKPEVVQEIDVTEGTEQVRTVPEDVPPEPAPAEQLTEDGDKAEEDAPSHDADEAQSKLVEDSVAEAISNAPEESTTVEHSPPSVEHASMHTVEIEVAESQPVDAKDLVYPEDADDGVEE